LPKEATHKKALEPRKQAGPPLPNPMQPGVPAPPAIPNPGERPERPRPMPPMRPGQGEEKKPAAPAKKPETGLLNRTTAARDHQYWVYVPENYDANVAHALVIWLHPPGKNKKEDID